MSISVRFILANDLLFLSIVTQPPPKSTLFPYTTLFRSRARRPLHQAPAVSGGPHPHLLDRGRRRALGGGVRSEEHTSELQSRGHLVCRLLLEKKKEKGWRLETNNQERRDEEDGELVVEI